MSRASMLRDISERLSEIEADVEELVRRRSSHPGPAPADDDEDEGRVALLPSEGGASGEVVNCNHNH